MDRIFMDEYYEHTQTMRYRTYVGDVEWQKLKTALALKPSVQM